MVCPGWAAVAFARPTEHTVEHLKKKIKVEKIRHFDLKNEILPLRSSLYEDDTLLYTT